MGACFSINMNWARGKEMGAVLTPSPSPAPPLHSDVIVLASFAKDGILW